MQVCPLIFAPIYKPKIWGGRRIETLLGRDLPQGDLIGESWEVADLEDAQSVVAVGPAAGKTLGQLVREWGTDLVGGAPLFGGRFPLLIKFLDACDTLSVQVHPDAAMAKRLGGRVRVKNEAWYVLHAEPDGCIYRGTAQGVTRETFEQAIEQQNVASLLNRVLVQQGDCYYLPSGTVHALGAGVVVAEVQTPSDITYRVFDWDRVDPATGEGRTLHIDQALECIHFHPGGITGEERSHVASVWTTVTRLVRCPSFIMERVRMVEGVDQEIPTGELMIWIVLEGAGTIRYNDGAGEQPFAATSTVVIPAGLNRARLITSEACLWIEVTIPVASSLGDFERPSPEALARLSSGSGLVQLDATGESEDESKETDRS